MFIIYMGYEHALGHCLEHKVREERVLKLILVTLGRHCIAVLNLWELHGEGEKSRAKRPWALSWD